ncbi:MAG TPA: indole-3-glycerol phosphate synthase TrpC [Solirubrobacteraceae bacterium]|jgi:indole-3-glycerol phosphate synthase|nr:indole-3-glycerol phosphate synthase TrpC [Solirubrobacteraceae bacterium]
MSAGTPNVLERILAEARRDLERRKRERPLDARTLASPRRRAGRGRFAEALAAPAIGVIAEFKRRSPSAGVLLENADQRAIVEAYARGGAVALSVLTEGPNFGGSLDDLLVAAEVCDLPRLRKDFIVDPYQLHESLAAGADAVLLIVAALGQRELSSLHEHARTLGLDVLVEVHDGDELRRALDAGAEIVGVNNRDLRDFSVDLERTERLMGEMPAGVTVVSESGIGSPEQLERLQRLGVQGVLVGESLMRSGDPQAALERLRTFRHTESAL